jgi:subtilisin-like proprotein convertase family protein
VTSGNAAEGLVRGGDSAGAFVPSLGLTFTQADWSTAQAVQVEGPLDWVDDDPQSYAITVGPTSSSGTPFDGLAAKSVQATNTDVDTAGFEVAPTNGLVTSEGGATATFTVKLTSKPLAPVTIPLRVDDAAEALVSAGGLSVRSLDLTFTDSNWNQPRNVTVTGQDEDVLDGPRPWNVAVGPTASGDAKYSGLAEKTVAGQNADNDVGTSEGTSSAVVLDLGSARASQVGPSSSSFYEVAIAAGASFGITVADATAAVTVTADDDGDYGAGNVCTASVAAGGAGTCVGRAPAGGTLYIRVSTGSAAGAGYRLVVTVGETFTSVDVPKAIPEGPSPLGAFQPAISTLSVAGAPVALSKITVKLSIAHTAVGNLLIVLRSPSGTEVTLSRYYGGMGHNYTATIFDDAAAAAISTGAAPFTGTFRPDAPLSTLAGEDPNGTWELRVTDPWVVDSGTITAWSIHVM